MPGLQPAAQGQASIRATDGNVALARKLESYQPLGEDDRRRILQLPLVVRRLGAREEIIGDEQAARGASFMLSGFACRLKTLPDGRRQITGLFVPGDFCDLHVIPVQRMGHALATLSPAVIGVLSNEAVRSTMEDHPNIARALWLSALVQEAVTREWLVSLGRRTAFERVAHLICEVYARLAAAGLARHGYCDWPLTQTDLADGLGLSAVHVNRTLQEMRREGLIRLQGRSLHLPDLDRLARAALFDPGYLHWDAPR